MRDVTGEGEVGLEKFLGDQLIVFWCELRSSDQLNMEETTLGMEKWNGMEKLTADTYHKWKFNMMMSLIGRDLWEIVEGSEVLVRGANENQRMQFRKRDNKALSMICLSVSN